MGLQSLGNVDNDSADLDIRSQVVPRTCGNNQEGTVGDSGSLTGGTTRWHAERKDRRPSRSATRLSGPRYCIYCWL